MKLHIEHFTVKEEYEWLGEGFRDWGLPSLDKLGASQRLSGDERTEEYKMIKLNRYLDRIKRKYFDKMKGS